MPLKSGKSSKTIGKNIGELISTFKKKGKIGTSKPTSLEAARKQAAAIALSKAKKTKKVNESFDTIVNDLMKTLL